MSDMIERAAKAAMDACEANYCEPRPDYTMVCVDGDTSFVPIARATLLAALDPHDSALQNVILGAMGFFCTEGGDFGPMARVQAHDAIEAMRKAASQGGSNP